MGKGGLRIAAAGDIAFVGGRLAEPIPCFFSEVRGIWADSDLVIGNLEGPLIREGDSVPGKCPLKSHPGWAAELANAGIRFVSLANNHMMDYGPDGLLQTLELLRNEGIAFVGAGADREQALAPVFVDFAGGRVAILARSAVEVASRCYATDAEPGVAYLDTEETEASLGRCRDQADLVVFCVHWGIEHHRYPRPEQRQLARRFAAAGADLVIGHHPHVLQGVERFEGGVVAYSLGDFVFDDFDWSVADEAGQLHRRTLSLRPDNRLGAVLRAWFEKERAANVELIPTCLPGDGRPVIERMAEGEGRAARLSKALRLPAYASLWRLYAAWMEWELRIRPRFFSSKSVRMITRMRRHHLRLFLAIIRRSGRLVSGKTTNPYDS